MKRIALGIVAGAALATAPAFALEAALPGGTPLSVTITSPENGAIVESSAAIPLTGTASIGGAKDTTVAYTVDVSSSVARLSNVNCDGIAGRDTVLTCEKAAVRAVNTQAASSSSPVANSGLVSFNTVGTAFDFDPGPAVQRLAAPGGAIESALTTLRAGGGTSFAAALNATKTVLTSAGVKPVKIVVFVSDGADTVHAPLPSLPAGTVVKAFAIGGSGCSKGNPSLNAVAAKGGLGSSCQVVTDLSVLDDVINHSITTTLTSIEVSVDGGPARMLLNTEVDPDLPQHGPATVSFSTTVGPLTEGPHQVCTKAKGSDAGGAGSATDCVNLQVVQDAVDCATQTCELAANDGDVSDAHFEGFNLTKVVGMRSADTTPTECGGQACVTGYDVLFDDDGGSGVAELTVVAARDFSTPPGHAAVFIDGVQVTAKCGGKHETLPCAKINRAGPGLTQYFVRFKSDPGVRFR
jgi:hypothetical protein